MSDKTTTLANRLADILQKLNTGQVIVVKELAIEYSVSERTIQKDLNQRLDPNLIEDLGNGRYKLRDGFLGNLTIEDIKEFSQLSGIMDLYPNIDDVISNKIKGSLLVKSGVNRGCLPKSGDFLEINYTITSGLRLKFTYNSKDLTVEPYKLLNNNGIWYLLAINSKEIKSYCLHKMKKVRRDVKSFIHNKELLEEIEKNPSPWFRSNKINVNLLVNSDFKDYFLDRNLIPVFTSKGEDDNGNLLISIKVNSLDEIVGTIKFWLPNIKVVSPHELKEKIIEDIKNFLLTN